MSTEITYERAGVTTDPAELAQYVIDCIKDNNKTNDAKTSDWGDAYDAIDVYLSHNQNLSPDESDVLEDTGNLVKEWMLADIASENKTTTFTITQPASGVVLGEYEGADEREAVLAMAKDAGYDSIEEMDEVTGSDSLNDLHFS